MALTNAYVIVYGKLGQVFQQICDGAAPAKFTTQHLKDWGFTSTNYRAIIPLLKALGFLTDDGTPTSRYHEYRNAAQSKRIMAEAIKDAYSDLFSIKAKPTSSDRSLIEGKFKSVHNISPGTATNMAKTFFALMDLADFSGAPEPKMEAKVNETESKEPKISMIRPTVERKGDSMIPSLNYNIEIHLPPTKDIEVFNAIFKSLKEHLLD